MECHGHDNVRPVPVPGRWESLQTTQGTPLSGAGYATYALRLVGISTPQMGLSIQGALIATKTFLLKRDGQVVTTAEHGVPAKSRHHEIGLNVSRYIFENSHCSLTTEKRDHRSYPPE